MWRAPLGMVLKHFDLIGTRKIQCYWINCLNVGVLDEMKRWEFVRFFTQSLHCGWNSYEMIMTSSSMFLAPSNISSSSVDLRCCAFVACLEVEVTGGGREMLDVKWIPIQSMYGIFSIFACIWLIDIPYMDAMGMIMEKKNRSFRVF